MGDFIKAALPWVAMGIAVAVLAADYGKRKKKRERAENDPGGKAEQDKETYLSEGMAVGMCLGCALGTTGLFDIGTGLSVGMLLGMAIGAGMKKP